MDPAAPQINYQDVLSEFIHRQTVILGPHITFAKVAHVKGITVDPKGYLKKVEGDPQQLLEEVVSQFKPLSEFLVKTTLETILSQHQSLTHFDANIAATKTHPLSNIGVLPQGAPVVHPSINPMHPLSSKPSAKPEHLRFGWFGKGKQKETAPQPSAAPEIPQK